MGDKIKQVPQQVLEFWKKFSSKQKTIIVSVAAAIVLTIIIFVVLFTKTTYEEIAVYSSPSDAAAAKEVLNDQGITYKVADDGVTLSVDKKKVADAKMALGENSIGVNKTTAYNYEDAFQNDISTTSKEKDQKWKLAVQNQLADIITQTIKGVKAASVQVTFADETTSILEDEKENTCAAMLTITDKFKKSRAKGIAQFLATSIGSTNTDNVKIIDQDGNILFSGSDNDTGSTSLSSASDYKDKVTNDLKTQVQALLLKSSNYNDVEVAPNMEINFDKSSSTDEHFYTDDGKETGPKKYDYNYANENNTDNGDVVGTDANDGQTTDYNTSSGGNSTGTTNITKNEYNTSKRTTVTQAGAAQIDYDKSSISIVLNKYHSYYEDALKDQLKKNNQTFDDFKQANGDSKTLTVDPTLITSVSKATGIAENNISIIAYEVPLFYESTAVSTATKMKSYLQYILALVIVALLLFVVFKGMKPVEVTEMEPELSVEALLATTKDNQGLDDIEFSDKSLAREQIEKFVDENPEAVAQLLRNWLNEDWE